MKEWIGVDLDGTLAEWDHWVAADVIGEPIPAMVEGVRRWLAEGRYDVRILTARVGNVNQDGSDELARQAIEAWSLRHFGVVLAVTDRKDYLMIELWDDRAVTVEMNTGRQLAPSTRGLS